ncbi:hypothetical protein C0989_011604 [Termitomyces sp. Mn162]|nr:hypothetical protein C0989_011604 [Termitomyces sp. Mn162]
MAPLKPQRSGNILWGLGSLPSPAPPTPACLVPPPAEWVVVQLEEGWRGRVLGRDSGMERGGSMRWPTMKIGPLWGGWREGAPVVHDKGKWRASPSLEAGLSPTVYSPTSRALVKFDGGPAGLEVALIELNQGAGGPVRGGIMSGIGMFGIGLIGGVYLIPEKLVEESEVLGNFMSNMGGDVFKG